MSAQTTIIPIEAELLPIPAASVNALDVFKPFAQILSENKERALAMTITAGTPPADRRRIAQEAQRLRLDCFAAARQLAEKAKTALKADILKMGRAIDGENGRIWDECQAVEKHLKGIEDFEENEQKRIEEEARQRRAAEIAPFLNGPLAVDLGKISEEEFQRQLTDAKDLHSMRMERERKAAEEAALKAEEERLERERVAREAEEAKKEAARLRAEAEEKEKARLAEVAALEAKARAEAADERARHAEEMAKVRAEQESKEAAERKVRAAAEAKLRAEKEAAERIVAEERRAREAAVRAAEEKEAQERAAAAALEAAGDAEKLAHYIAAVRAVPVPRLGNRATAAKAGAIVKTAMRALLALAATPAP